MTAQANINGASKMHDSTITKDMRTRPVDSATAGTVTELSKNYIVWAA